MVEFAILGDSNIASSRILVPVAMATVLPGVSFPVSGTVSVGTVAVGIGTVSVVATVQAVATIVSPVLLGASTPTSATVSATISGGPGTLYGVVSSNQGTVAGTVIVFAGGIGAPIIAIVPSGDMRGWINPKGIAYSGSLVASLQGQLQVTVM